MPSSDIPRKTIQTQYPGLFSCMPLFLSISVWGIGNSKCLLTLNCIGEDRWVLKPDIPPSQSARLISPSVCQRFKSHQRWPSPASSTYLSSMIHCMMVDGSVEEA